MSSESTRVTLLSRVRNGDPQSWREFDALYRELILRYCRRAGLQQSDAEDVRQTLMMKLAQRMPTFVYRPEHGSFRAYLRRATRNAILSVRERRDPAAGGGDGRDLEALEGDAGADADLAWDEEWRAHHLRHAMAKARAAFEPRTLEVFDRLLAGDPIDAIAASHSMTADAVYRAKVRVREFLRQRIAEQVRAEEFHERG